MLLLLLTACLGATFGDPCADYCDYICECHEGEAEFDCDQCRTENSGDDAELQDACESALSDLQTTDAAEGTGCSESVGDDTGL